MAKVIAEKLGMIPHSITSHKKEINHKISIVLKVVLRTLFLIGIGYVMLYPILTILSGAFKAEVDAYDPTVIWIPKHFSMLAMNLVYKTIKFPETVRITLTILIPSVLLQMISTLMAGYGFARFKFKGRGVLFALLVFTIIVPVQNIMVPLYADMQSFDMFGIFHLIKLITGHPLPRLLNTYLPFYVMAAFGMGIRSGLYIFIMRQFFMNMPNELEEAAMIDGCGTFKTFTSVMLPNVIPAMVTIIVFSVVWYWNDYYQAQMFESSNQPLSVMLTLLNDRLTSNQKQLGIAATDLLMMKDSLLECGCLLVMTPLLVMYIFLQRFFTESIERTGIVG